MVCEFKLVKGAVRVNCIGCVFGSSIEDFEACMATTIDKMMQVKKADRVVLAEMRETEYDFLQTRMLVQIADIMDLILNKQKIIEIKNLGPRQCEHLYSRRMEELQFVVFQLLRKDPIGAYMKLRQLIHRNKFEMKTAKQKVCYQHYIDHALNPILLMLERTELIRRARPYLKDYKFGDRTIYREVFKPVTKPNFMFTRFMIQPPRGGTLLDRYMIGDTAVELFRVPGNVRTVYHMVPPEFKLDERRYAILDEARRYLGEHRPPEAEFADPDRLRSTFTNIGIGVIRDVANRMGIPLTDAEIATLARILARYTAGFGVLELLLQDNKVQDLYINSPIGVTPIYIYHADFEECETNLIPTREDAEAWATRFRLYSGRPLDEANPVLDTELRVPGGRARVAAITNTLSPEGLAFALRRHREQPWTFPLFIKHNFINSIYAGLMSFIVDGGRAILIAGGRSSGKTSLLGAIMLEVMRKFRLVVQEDTLELPVVQMRSLGYNVERLKSRSVITRVETELPAEEALRTALRLGDSVLILGEIRSTEGKALFEAMRIGALANLVAGTVHGESPYGVYDRVVNDLGVPSTSFKAIDLITVCNMLQSPDGMHRFRRVVGLTEVRKQWKDDPQTESGFFDLMQYSAKEDRLKPTATLTDGESEVLMGIARRVKDWHGRWDAMWDNILLRAKIKQALVDYSDKYNMPQLLEAGWTVASNEEFHMISDQVRKEAGDLDSTIIYQRWEDWLRNRLRRGQPRTQFQKSDGANQQ